MVNNVLAEWPEEIPLEIQIEAMGIFAQRIGIPEEEIKPFLQAIQNLDCTWELFLYKLRNWYEQSSVTTPNAPAYFSQN
jgi:hypothetical protein